MSVPFIGEIRMGGWNFAPRDWALCQGQLMRIEDNATLFSVIGTTYGGDGVTTFGLPDLQGRVPMHRTSNFPLGREGGAEAVTLSTAQLPTHNHPFAASLSAGNQPVPTGNVPAALPSGAGTAYVADPPAAALAAQSIGTSAGSGLGHDNMQPFMTLTFIISLMGIYPTPT